jgi:hypothetical protein
MENAGTPSLHHERSRPTFCSGTHEVLMCNARDKAVGKAAAQDIGLSEMENTHGVVMLKSSGAVARQ